MSDLNPTEVYERYRRKELDAAAAVNFLKAIIESGSEANSRVQSVVLLGKFWLNKDEDFKFLENLATSDENSQVRLESMKLILQIFPDRKNTIEHIIKHEKFVDNLQSLYRTLEKMNSEDSKRILNEMEFIIGKKYSLNFKIVPKEAMALHLISMLTGLDAIHIHYWRDAACVAIKPRRGTVVELVLHNVNYTEIILLDFFPNLEYLTISSTDLTEIKNLESLTKLKYLNLYYNKISKIKGLEKLVNLEEIDLSYNPITKVEGLETLDKLKKVNFEDCNIEYDEIEAYFHKINKNNVKIY